MKTRTLSKAAVIVAPLSFILHFAWEWSQCVPFFIHPRTPTALSMISASLGDVLITIFILATTMLVTKTRSLSQLMTLRALLIIEGFAFLLAVMLEKFALNSGRWSYTSINPILPVVRVSMIPVIQLMLLTPIIVFLAATLNKGLSK